MDAVEDAGPGQEGAQDGERERGAQQRQVPDPQHAAPLLHHHRVEVGGGREPGQERGVLDRVPGPEAAPAQHLVAPPGAHGDADGEAAPGQQRPASGLDQPPLPQAAGDEGGDGKRERDGEPYVAQVQDRRVDQHQRVVLQQRVGTGAVQRDGADRAEGVGRTDEQAEEEDRHHQDAERGPRHDRVVAAAAEPPHHRRPEAGQHKGPEEDRPLEPAPQRRDRVNRRRGQAVVLGHVPEGEVRGQQGPLHGQEGHDGTAQHHPDVHGARAQQRHSPGGQAHAQGDYAGDPGGQAQQDPHRAEGGVHDAGGGA